MESTQLAIASTNADESVGSFLPVTEVALDVGVGRASGIFESLRVHQRVDQSGRKKRLGTAARQLRSVGRDRGALHRGQPPDGQRVVRFVPTEGLSWRIRGLSHHRPTTFPLGNEQSRRKHREKQRRPPVGLCLFPRGRDPFVYRQMVRVTVRAICTKRKDNLRSTGHDGLGHSRTVRDSRSKPAVDQTPALRGRSAKQLAGGTELLHTLLGERRTMERQPVIALAGSAGTGTDDATIPPTESGSGHGRGETVRLIVGVRDHSKERRHEGIVAGSRLDP